MAREESFFDELAKGLAEGTISRRRALKLFAGSAIAALVPARAFASSAKEPHGAGAKKCKPPKVEICHKPPGNPKNAHTICVSQKEAQSHINQHGDTMGACGNPTGTTSTSTSTSTTSTSTSTTSTTPICLPEFAECTADTQCCSRICDSPSFPDLCQQCRFPGGSCTAGETCCDVNSISGPSFCVSGKCCAPEQRACNANIQCCPGLMCMNFSFGQICVS